MINQEKIRYFKRYKVDEALEVPKGQLEENGKVREFVKS